MSLVLIATVAAASAAIAAGAAVLVRRASRPAAAPCALPDPPRPPFDRVGLQPGDVVLRGREEMWLTGAWVLREGTECVAAVFTAGGSSAECARALIVCPGPPRAVAWVCACETSIATDSLELGEERYARKARVPVSIERHGAAPELAAEGTWHRYESAGGAPAFGIVAGERTLVWRGTWEGEGSLTRMAAGEATLRRG